MRLDMKTRVAVVPPEERTSEVESQQVRRLSRALCHPFAITFPNTATIEFSFASLVTHPRWNASMSFVRAG